MKKILIIGVVIVVLLIVVVMQINNLQTQQKQAIQFNKQYEEYKDKDLYGIDIVTVINKATDNNEKNDIPKDQNQMYIENDENSIKVELNLISDVDDRTGQKKYVTHQMERLQQVGLDGFITNFNLTTFKCEKIEYHKKTGKVSKIIFRQIEE